ncbi:MULTISPECIES: hypothetical protein [unclassified Rhizobium]|uniref:hypothetical protein n=1 Tax=unclassified Rhizobium TaxID=2613769 RepID=UPI0015CDC33A|nr:MULTISPECIES: hypothetical protein [unclassified Rhizobium]MDH7809793.1 hypothetical protein [Rhizobium sp. AN67]MDQ4406454.1 hypothetical protein [Rhizobium sp. AN63]
MSDATRYLLGITDETLGFDLPAAVQHERLMAISIASALSMPERFFEEFAKHRQSGTRHASIWPALERECASGGESHGKPQGFALLPMRGS